jgi:hypothetical protein
MMNHHPHLQPPQLQPPPSNSSSGYLPTQYVYDCHDPPHPPLHLNNVMMNHHPLQPQFQSQQHHPPPYWITPKQIFF